MGAKVIFHLPKQFCDNFLEFTHLALFHKIHELIESRGGHVEVRRRHEALRGANSSDWSAHLEADNLHIIENGTVQQPNALNAALAYLPPYFHLDALGVLADSSAAQEIYDEAKVNPVLAQSNFLVLQDRLVRKRRSRYGPKKDITKIPKDCIAVFLQGDNPHRQGTAHCDNETLLRTVAKHAGNRKIVVKAHPMSKQLDDVQLLLRLLQEGLPLVATDANVHDILQQCAVTVSYNSAVAIEGFLHNKPAILFGRSDFHHVAETVEFPCDFPRALHSALNSQRNYAKYLFWYFSQFAVSAEDWDLNERLLKRFEWAGFSVEDLGLQGVGETEHNRLDRSRGNQAVLDTQRLLDGMPHREGIILKRPLLVDNCYQEFLATYGDQKVRICRHLSADGAQKVRDRASEINHVQEALDSASFTAEKVLFIDPGFGLMCVTHPRGVPLQQKIAGAAGNRRSKFVSLAAKWLEVASLSCQRKTEFSFLDTLKPISDRPLETITDDEDCALLKLLLSNLTKRARRIEGTEITQFEGLDWFSVENLIHKNDVLCAINIRGAQWTSVSRVSARFLVDLQMHDPAVSDHRKLGICQGDWRAFMSHDLVPENERRTALPFFVGEQLYRSFVLNYADTNVQKRGRDAIRAYLA
ncbi:hypothetical protein [uncultured Shimia sp.]|uniref:capsular polysaccharide export protein, LipB/KpsS family n=1 Tax=uncultured Shimia sp. TaxID=573152 RepID=UPI00260442B2|nr:hypothetical protein [uncultured Shimia sp.]